MKKKIFCSLLSICFLIGSITSATAYTIIYKSGKKIEGTWLSEDQQAIRIKDKEGIILSVSKTQLDLRAMAAGSRYPVKQQKQQPAKPEPVLVKEAPVTSSTAIQETGTDIQQPPTGLPPEIAKPRTDAKPGQRLTVFTSLYNGYDSNIDHDLEAIESYGVVYGGGVRFRNRPKDPVFWVSYEIANHHYTNTDKWDRVSQSILSAYNVIFSDKWQLQNLGEISFKGSSEDRELSDNYVFRPLLQYRWTDNRRFNFFVAQRYKRFDEVESAKNANNRFAGVGFQQELGKHEVELTYKYEKNNGESDRNDYVRSTYTVEYKMPFLKRTQAEFEFKIRPTRFSHRFAEIDVEDGPDIEVPRRDIKWNFTVEFAIPLSNHLELIPTYEFEKRTSNDPEEFYTAHLPALTLHYTW